MLYKLSLKNIKKSIKDYAIYFFTLILGISIFYVFNALDTQTAMIDVASSTRELIKLMMNTLSAVSVFVSFILGFLIIYASRFLMKRRNKEFGIYLTLGMSKRKISMILFFETLIIGVLSLVVGLSVGVVLSQLMSVIVVNMFEADLTKFTFVFSSSAFIKTIIYFSIMYIFVMIFNTISVSKCKLIDLLHSNKKSEELKIKNPYKTKRRESSGPFLLSFSNGFLVSVRRGQARRGDALRIAGPVAPGAQHLLHDVAHGARAACKLRHVARRFDHLGRRIGRADRNPHFAHALQVGNVVAHVDDVRRVDSLAAEIVAEGGYLVHAVEVVFLDSKHLQPVFQRPAPAARYDADPVAHLDGIGQRIAVLGVVAADKIALDRGHDAPVGHHTVHIEDEGFGAGYVLLEVSHMCWLIVV